MVGCSISPPWPLISDGRERACRRRTTNHATMTTPRVKTKTAPTTPPASAPVFELLVEVDDRPPPVAPGVIFDSETWLVDVGVIEAVLSGESRQDEYMCVYRAQRSRIPPPLSSALESFQVSLCKGTVDGYFLGKQAKSGKKVPTDVSMYAQLGTRVSAGTGSGKLGWKPEAEHMSQ